MSELNGASSQDPQFVIQRLYVKDLSFETPNSPQSFQQEWQPETTLELNTAAQSLGNQVYEVLLNVTVTVKNQTKVAFLCEVKQAGIFSVTGADDNQLQHILGSYCPSILFPYAREVVTDIVVKGSFPQLVLAPVNFDALYAEQLQDKQTGQKNNEVKEVQDTIIEE